jgi:hypothetical protein
MPDHDQMTNGAFRVRHFSADLSCARFAYGCRLADAHEIKAAGDKRASSVVPGNFRPGPSCPATFELARRAVTRAHRPSRRATFNLARRARQLSNWPVAP